MTVLPIVERNDEFPVHLRDFAVPWTDFRSADDVRFRLDFDTLRLDVATMMDYRRLDFCFAAAVVDNDNFRYFYPTHRWKMIFSPKNRYQRRSEIVAVTLLVTS